jgi:hypothetical protein
VSIVGSHEILCKVVGFTRPVRTSSVCL